MPHLYVMCATCYRSVHALLGCPTSPLPPQTRSGDLVCLVELLDEAKVRWASQIRVSNWAAPHPRSPTQTRSGDLVRLVELLDEAKVRCASQIRARMAEAGEVVDEAALEAAAAAMGYGAVRKGSSNMHTSMHVWRYIHPHLLYSLSAGVYVLAHGER